MTPLTAHIFVLNALNARRMRWLSGEDPGGGEGRSRRAHQLGHVPLTEYFCNEIIRTDPLGNSLINTAQFGKLAAGHVA
jgi:hypothetical protein